MCVTRYFIVTMLIFFYFLGHFYECEDQTVQIYACSHCQFTAGYKKKLRAHVKDMHEALNTPDPSKGLHDKSKFSRQFDGGQTKTRQRGSERVQLFCEDCSYSTQYRSRLKDHVDRIHLGVKYPCTHCDYKATTAATLRRHFKTQHEGVRFQCNLCSHIASYESDLNIHIKAKHEGIVHQCDQCDFVASKACYLKEHKQTKHEGVRFPCLQCPHVASSKGSLARHIRTIHFKADYP